MEKEEKRLIETPHGEPKEMTYAEWLASADTILPEGFEDWPVAKFLWDHGKEIGWAVYKFKKHQELHGPKHKVTIT